uniref:Chitin-binding type-2 domain-containing protein n=1 Tax=Timema tahoe TaxID=61484 RepID=A0A7R9IBB3_9NEOP|nr:unnamed protein product [Timema tahoe]
MSCVPGTLGVRVRTKKIRAPSVTELSGGDPQQYLHPDRNTPTPETNTPLGFLSPSVKEYLELGKSIPGNNPRECLELGKSIPGNNLREYLELGKSIPGNNLRECLELGKSIPGRPGTDYPVLASVPYTNFYCDEQPYPGFFADTESRCQAWHYCDIDGRQATFLCPNGTQFSQAVFVCDWWFNVRCDLSEALYVINTRLYGTPRENPARPHRVITKELLQNIFLK